MASLATTTYTPPTRNVCFIHSTTMNVWGEEPLHLLLTNILESKIIDLLDYVLVNNIGNALDPNKYASMHPKFIIVNYSFDLNLFENVTIRSLYQFSKMNPNCNVLYLHTKGVSYPKDHPFVPGIFSWIRFMLYSLVYKHQECLQMLNVYDTVGCNHRDTTIDQENPPHFSGNFWWATTDYISTLPIHYMKDKYDAEFWLLRNKPTAFHGVILHHLYQVEYRMENYKLFVDNAYEEQTLYCVFGNSVGIGLCNQLYSLVNTLLMGYVFPGFTTVIVDDFLSDINTNDICDSREIINYSKMNEFLKPYNVKMIYKRDVRLEIKEVMFGIKPHKTVDITQKAIELFYRNNQFEIPKGTNLNDLCEEGDPLPNTRKHIYVHYMIDGRSFFKTFDEILMTMHRKIFIDFKDMSTLERNSKTSIKDAKRDKFMFNHFMKNICFVDKFHEISDTFCQNLSEKINVIHLRIEDDALQFWANINRIQKDLYKNVLIQKYIRNIQNHIPIDSTTIILSMDTDNDVTRFMRENGYKYTHMDKTLLDGREVNAIIDLLISEHCNGVFIGNINPNNYHGSTFSYAIYNHLRDKPVKKICIDTDQIFSKEIVVE